MYGCSEPLTVEKAAFDPMWYFVWWNTSFSRYMICRRFRLADVAGRAADLVAEASSAANEPDKAARYLAQTPTRLDEETTWQSSHDLQA